MVFVSCLLMGYKYVCFGIPGWKRASPTWTRRRGAFVPHTWSEIRKGPIPADALRVDDVHIPRHLVWFPGHTRPQLRCHPRERFHREQQRGRAGLIREDPPPLPTTPSNQLRKRVQIQNGNGNQEC